MFDDQVGDKTSQGKAGCVRCAAYERELTRANDEFKRQIQGWADYNDSARKSHFLGGLAVGLVAATFLVGFVFTQVLPTEPEVVIQKTGVTIPEYKHVVNSLDKCNEDFRWVVGERDELQIDNDYLYNLKFWSAYDDAGSARCAHKGMMSADWICQTCQNEIVMQLWDCQEQREDECWCPFGNNPEYSMGGDELGYQEIFERLDDVCRAVELASFPADSSWEFVWWSDCLRVNDRVWSEAKDYFEAEKGKVR